MKLPRINPIRPPNTTLAQPPGRRWIALAPILICLVAAPAALPVAAPPPAAGASGAATAEATTTEATEDVQVLLTTPAKPSEGSPLFTLPWGDGPGQVGLARRAEEESRGPEGLAVAPDGRVAVLDSVNSRLLLLTPTGDPLAAAPLDVAAPRFLAVDGNQVFVLDADDSLRLLTFSWSGAPLADISVGPFEDPVTALLVDSQGEPLIETNHDRVAAPANFRLGLTGQAEARGRPSTGARGRSVSAQMTPGGRPSVEESDLANSRRRRWDVELRQGRTVDHLVSLDTDDRGRVMVGLRLAVEQSAAAASAGAASLLLTRLDEPTQTLLLQEKAGTYLGAPYVVAPSGLIYQPLAADEGYRIVTHAFPDVHVEVK